MGRKRRHVTGQFVAHIERAGGAGGVAVPESRERQVVEEALVLSARHARALLVQESSGERYTRLDDRWNDDNTPKCRLTEIQYQQNQFLG